MVEVFKTNVRRRSAANRLVDHIHKAFSDYKANFDLHDCDNILRVECATGNIQSSRIISLLEEQGFHAEILSDNGQLVYTSQRAEGPAMSAMMGFLIHTHQLRSQKAGGSIPSERK